MQCYAEQVNIYQLANSNAVFDSHLNYNNLIWGQNTNTILTYNYFSKKGIKFNELLIYKLSKFSTIFGVKYFKTI